MNALGLISKEKCPRFWRKVMIPFTAHLSSLWSDVLVNGVDFNGMNGWMDGFYGERGRAWQGRKNDNT